MTFFSCLRFEERTTLFLLPPPLEQNHPRRQLARRCGAETRGCRCAVCFRVENQQGGRAGEMTSSALPGLTLDGAPLRAHTTPEIYFLTPNEINTSLAPYYLLKSVSDKIAHLREWMIPHPSLRSALSPNPPRRRSHLRALQTEGDSHQDVLRLSVCVSFFFQGVFSTRVRRRRLVWKNNRGCL